MPDEVQVRAEAGVVALLRAINVGGRNIVPMPALRDLLAAAGFNDVRSHLNSGNLIFRQEHMAGSDDIERLLQSEIAARFGQQIDVFVRRADEMQMIVERNPFMAQAAGDASRLLVIFLKRRTEAAQVAALQAGISGGERLHAGERELYAVYPDGIGRSRLTSALIERMLGCSSTGRNWNTVLKLTGLTRQ